MHLLARIVSIDFFRFTELSLPLFCGTKWFANCKRGVRKMPSEEKPKKGTKEKRGTEKSKATEVQPVNTPSATEPSSPVKATGLKTTPPAKAAMSEPKPKKAAVPKTTTIKASTKKSTPAAGKITVEQIQLRAYFIAERRKHQGIPGDEASDWIQAERELQSELGK
jgi:DUF2934 family protein